MVGKASPEFIDALCPDEPAGGLSSADVGQLAIWAVLLRVVRIMAAAGRIAAGMVLAGDAAWVDWAQLQQLLFDRFDFPVQPGEFGFVFHNTDIILRISVYASQNMEFYFMSDAEIVEHLYRELAGDGVKDRTMGELENLIDQRTRGIRRHLLERMVQDAAGQEVLGCPACGAMLTVVGHRRRRTVDTLFGKIGYLRGYGWCERCQSHVAPADGALGLHVRARSSPRLQEICALTVLHGPAARAEEDVRRMTGISIGASTLHREARRQGERALQIRELDTRRSESPKGAAILAARAPTLPKDSTLVIQMDAWNIRERDHWGRTQALREAGEEAGRWHWVYTGTVFRLDQSGTTQSGRPVITDRGYVATRAGLDPFRRQLHAEALQRGLRQAGTVLVLGDGAVWIWNLAAKQFKGARQRVDLFHVKQHLWTLAAELWGKDTPEAGQWVRPYLQWLDRRQDGALDVIGSLDELLHAPELADQRKQAALTRELGYLNEHRERMDYKAAKALGQPCGSGAIESTCSQYQRRFKLTGQFWSLEGDEAFLALATLHRNGRWHHLFAHDEA